MGGPPGYPFYPPPSLHTPSVCVWGGEGDLGALVLLSDLVALAWVIWVPWMSWVSWVPWVTWVPWMFWVT